jgi:methylenetetrahydrofolate dehydrogenase (NADP+)/methenyltetrahydrofolate cyclohydrolase
VSQAELNATVERICNDPSTTGVLVQLPLPAQLSEEALAESFHPQKDVDAFHPLNMGRVLMRNRSASMVPCTAMVRPFPACIFQTWLSAARLSRPRRRG